MKSLKLLLVEDDEDDYLITRDLLVDIFSDSFTLDWVHSPSDVEEEFKRNAHDICLMDYSLGAFNGLTLLWKSAELGFSAPIIMLTGQVDARLDSEALEAGAVDFLEKNDLNQTRLARAIRYAISRKEFESERAKRLSAEADSRFKNEFMAKLSHELRSPLTAIIGYTDIIIEKYTDPKLLGYQKIVRDNSEYLLKLINDVLNFTKNEPEIISYEKEPFLLCDMFDDLSKQMVVLIAEKPIKFKLNLIDPLPNIVISDKSRLVQILLNLLSNAVKFTEKGHVALICQQTKSNEGENEKRTLVIQVRDTGAGIPQDKIDTIFSPFNNTEQYDSSNQKGSGLGLSIANQLAQGLGGTIKVASTLGKGSMFTLELPVIEGKDDSIGEYRINSNKNTRKLDQKKILIVDDIDEIRELVGHILKHAGANISYAGDGLEAVKTVSNTEAPAYDAIILDLNMPNLDGFEALNEIRKIGYTKPIFALTASTLLNEIEAANNSGFTAHISKPIDAEHLLDTISHFINQQDSNLQTVHKKIKAVAVVEDNDDARDAMTELLLHLDYEVKAYGTAEEAIEMIRFFSPDIVFTDINLPGMDGYRFSHEIKHISPEVTIIAVTGETVSPSMVSNSGFDDCILKPLSLEKLNRCLMNVEESKI